MPEPAVLPVLPVPSAGVAGLGHFARIDNHARMSQISTPHRPLELDLKFRSLDEVGKAVFSEELGQCWPGLFVIRNVFFTFVLNAEESEVASRTYCTMF